VLWRSLEIKCVLCHKMLWLGLHESIRIHHVENVGSLCNKIYHTRYLKHSKFISSYSNKSECSFRAAAYFFNQWECHYMLCMWQYTGYLCFLPDLISHLIKYQVHFKKLFSVLLRKSTCFWKVLRCQKIMVLNFHQSVRT
jgi:hypothetical protein